MKKNIIFFVRLFYVVLLILGLGVFGKGIALGDTRYIVGLLLFLFVTSVNLWRFEKKTNYKLESLPMQKTNYNEVIGFLINFGCLK